MPALGPLPEELPTSFTVAEARRRGVSRRRMRHASLSRAFHGIRDQLPPEDLEALCRSYAARMRPDEFFCSATAALLHGIPLPDEIALDDRIHVAVPNPRRAPRSAGVVGHKFVVHPATGEVIDLLGLRVSSAARAWCELGRLLDRDELVVAGDHVARAANGLGGVRALRRALEKHPDQRTRPRLEEAFALIDPRAESPGETRIRLILSDAGIRGFATNLPVPVPGSPVRRRIDLAFPERMVALEYQGDHHRDPHQWRMDMSRAAELESLGWRVSFVNAHDLRHPAELVARVRRLLARAPRRSGEGA